MSIVAPRRTLGALAVLVAIALSAPAPARAGNCAVDYLVCLNTYSDYVTSDAYHEQQCWGDYLGCIRRLILVV